MRVVKHRCHFGREQRPAQVQVITLNFVGKRPLLAIWAI